MDDLVLLRFLGRLHPLVVHFPIALVLLATLLECAMVVRRGHRVSRTALTCLAFGAMMAGLAAWLGWLNAAHEPRAASAALTVLLHRWIGVAAASLAGLALVLGWAARGSRAGWVVRGYRGSLILAAMLVGVGSYFGAELVHGRNYLTSIFRAPATAEIAPVATPPVPAAVSMIDFETQVRPIILEHCVHCHGSQRQRGDLVLDPIDAVLARTGENRVIVPGDAEGSPLVRRIGLPADHPDLMPADDDPLPAEKVATVARWIEQGAERRDSSVARVDPHEPIQHETWAIELDAAAARARDEAVAGVLDRGGLALPVAAGVGAVDVNLAVISPPARDDDLVLLAGLESCLVQLNLSRTDVTDAGLASLAPFGELRRLRLDHTRTSDDGLAHLTGLDRLTDLNLYGTAIGDGGLELVAKLPRLERLYVGATRVSASGVETLRAVRPEIAVVWDPPSLPLQEAVTEGGDPR